MEHAKNARLVNHTTLNAMFGLLPDFDSREARVMLLAIGLQESRLLRRAQITRSGVGKGPARGLWQFESGGGVHGVLTHRATQHYAVAICEQRSVTPGPRYVWQALETDDILAAAFARLLLFSDQKKLPRLGDDEAAWSYYVRNWRPGKPHPETWPGLYAIAVDTVTGAGVAA